MTGDVVRIRAAQVLVSLQEEATRIKLGVGAATPPEILYSLASDPCVAVRAAVATNDATPLPVAHTLAADADETVRAAIARKLAALAPGLSANEQDRLRRRTYEALISLVGDEAERVRAAVADVLQEMPDAPRAMILALARDPVVTISDPVIRLSPVLTPNDLLELLTSPHPTTTVSVARRPDLTETISDRIAATANVGAIGALLRNSSAAIREATLDALITRAAEQIDWHQPLVRRPRLTTHLARRIADVVETNLVEALASRTDLAPDLRADFARRLRLRSTQDNTAAPTSIPKVGALATARSWTDDDVQSGDAARVTESVMAEALARGDARLVAALLARAAASPLSMVDRAVALRSAKGLVSLVWKAGFSMRVAMPVEALLGVAPSELLRPTPSGDFPLSTDEMRWQIEFLSRARRHAMGAVRAG